VPTGETTSNMTWEAPQGPQRERPRDEYGLVTRLVERARPPDPAKRRAVLHLGRLSRICVVEHLPAVGDLVRGEVPGVVEKVSVTRNGMIMIHARPSAPSVPDGSG
jgi:hypothetical protein